MTSITDFLLARIAEDEADPWRGAEIIGADRAFGQAERDALRQEEAEWEARVLAECQAKRRIVKAYPILERTLEEHSLCAVEPEVIHLGWVIPDALCILAAIYADHPDYDPAWRVAQPAAVP